MRWIGAVAVFCALTWAPAAWSAPPNDLFGNAQVLQGAGGTVSGTTIDATTEPGEPEHGIDATGASVWFRWTAPVTGTATFDLCAPETAYDTILAVYTGGPVDQLSSVGRDDDGCGELSSSSTVSFSAAAGTTYSIAVDGYAPWVGDFVLRWRLPPTNHRTPAIAAAEPEHGVVLTRRPAEWSGAEPIQRTTEWQRCNAALPANVAVGRPVSATGFDQPHPPEHAVDGRLDTYWTAGDFAPQWIDLDLRGPHPLSRIRLHVSQLPNGVTGHRILGRMSLSRGWTSLHTFSGITVDGQALEYDPPVPTVYRYLRIETTSSPSWVGWREIEVLSPCRPIENQTGDSYVLDSRDVGSTVRVVERASNAGGEEAVVSAETAQIRAARAPVSQAKPEIVGRPTVGSELVASQGSWTSASPFGLTWLWQRCRPGATSCGNVVGATSAEYRVRSIDIGFVLRVVVTATNAGGATRVESERTRVVPAPPACVVPRLRLKTVPQARRALTQARCRLGRVKRVRSRVRRGRVIAQGRRARTRLPVGTRISIVVSRGR